uniref:K+ potassium transporter integral membrane domain-containing protein n=1 Tax=Aegilops tauschii subsp. strangulata TaxID=200361 RepID=A0A453GL33_AEGTS
MSVEAEGAAGAETRVPRDSLYGDAEKVSDDKHHGSGAGWWQTLQLAFQSIGVVYGDVGTSPLYVYSSTFPDGIRHPDDLLGVLSLIIYTLVLLPMLKYVFIVLYANDNGDGGTFALYSLISRYAKIRLIPNQQAEDASVSNYSIEEPNSQMRRAQWVKQRLESSKAAKIALFTITILGTSMVMGDGTLTPAISVLSAVSGIREKAPNLTQSEVVWISVAILFLLFSVQRFGTDKVGYSFAPIISVWFIFIAGIGVYNLAAHDVTVLRAFNPKYIVDYFGRNGKEAWVSLGGVVLCITGTEAMFADLGHFNIRAIQLSFTFILFPSVALCYMGQASYLRKFPQDVGDTFYKSIPGRQYNLSLQLGDVLADVHRGHHGGHHREPGHAVWRVRHPVQGALLGLLPKGEGGAHVQQVLGAGVHPGGELPHRRRQHCGHPRLPDHHQHRQRLRDMRGDGLLHHDAPHDGGDAAHLEEEHRLRRGLLRHLRARRVPLPLVHPLQVRRGRVPALLLFPGAHGAHGHLALRLCQALLVRARPCGAGGRAHGALGLPQRAAGARRRPALLGARPGHPSCVPVPGRQDPIGACRLRFHVHQEPPHPAGGAARALHLP